MRKYDSPARIQTPLSCVQGRRDNHYTTGEPTAVTADEIAQLIFITSLRSRGRILAGEPHFRIVRYILLLPVDISSNTSVRLRYFTRYFMIVFLISATGSTV